MFTFLIRYFFNSSYDPFNETAPITIKCFWGNCNTIINASWGNCSVVNNIPDVLSQTINASWGSCLTMINALWGYSVTPTELLNQNLGSIRNDVATSIIFSLDGIDIDPNAVVKFNLSFLTMDKPFFSTICIRSGNNFQAFIPPNINPKMPSATANFSLYWDGINGPTVLAAGQISIEQWVQN